MKQRSYLWAGTIFTVAGLFVLMMLGCMTQHQKDSEVAYYQAKVQVAKEKQSQPIFRMTPIEAGKPIVISNGTMEIFAQPQNSDANFAQYQHRDFTPSWIPSLLNAAAPLGILYGGSLLLKSVPNSGGNITDSYNTRTNTATTTTTSTSLSNAVSGSGNQANIGGQATQATAPPTVVVVEQPPPIIVTQPPPIVVLPSYPPGP